MVVHDRDLNRISFRQSKYQYSEQLRLRLFTVIPTLYLITVIKCHGGMVSLARDLVKKYFKNNTAL